MSGMHNEVADADPANTRTSFEDLSAELLASSFVSGTQMAKVLAENRRLKQELDDTKKELENAKRELQDKELVKKVIGEDAEMHTRYWLPDEHQRFLVGLQKFGHKDMKSIAEYVGTRNTVQVRTHAQKYLLKLERHGKSLGDLGLPDPPAKDSGEDANSPSEPPTKRSRSTPEKSVKEQSATTQQAHNPSALPSVQAGKLPLDVHAFSRPAPDAAASGVLNHGYVLTPGFDVNTQSPMVHGIDVSRPGGLMLAQPFSAGPGDAVSASGVMKAWSLVAPAQSTPLHLSSQPWQNVRIVQQIQPQMHQAQTYHMQQGGGAQASKGPVAGGFQQEHLGYFQPHQP